MAKGSSMYLRHRIDQLQDTEVWDVLILQDSKRGRCGKYIILDMSTYF